MIDGAFIYATLSLLYTITVFSIISVVISENRNPLKSIAWVTVLFLLPIIGMVFYLVFGRSLRRKRMITKRQRGMLLARNKVNGVEDIDNLQLTPESIQQIHLAQSLLPAAYYLGNKIDIYTNGEDKFRQFKADLIAAHSYINMQYFIFEDDKIGTEISDILIAKAKEGVDVRIIYDHLGCWKVKNSFYKRMRDAGIEVAPFFKVTFSLFTSRINWRNHRKIAVIDGEIGYIGGMNIADRYIDGLHNGVWRDTHIRIQGAAIAGLEYSFTIDWSFMGNSLLDLPIKDFDDINGGAGMQMMVSGPMGKWSNMAFMFQKSIMNSKKRVLIQTPYFLPTESLLKALQTTALSKVEVSIMIPRNPDSWVLKLASSSFIAECLRAGIKIYFYEAGMLHAKTIIIDDEFSTVGSSNFDYRSFEHNFESNMFIYSKDVNKQMADIFYKDVEQCTLVDYSSWMERSTLRQRLESVIRLLSPIL
ncbi:MAG: cardiolipin synthase [Bacteroidales bacterium]